MTTDFITGASRGLGLEFAAALFPAAPWLAAACVVMAGCVVNPVPTPAEEGGTTKRSTSDSGATDRGGQEGASDVSAATDSAMAEPDAGANKPDSSTPDSSTPDSSTPDSSTLDSSTLDSSTPDSSTPDTSAPDTLQPPDTSGAFFFSSFKILKGWGPCRPKMICNSSWVLEQDGKLAVTKKGTKTDTALSATDLAKVLPLMAQQAFIDGMTKGFTCDQPPSDIFISFELALSGATHKQPVTGCVIAGPAGNVAQQLDKVISAY
jgi:hypothetical protein